MRPLPPPPTELPEAGEGGCGGRRDGGRRLERRLRLARAVLAWERLWPLLLPPLAVAATGLSLALLDVLPLLPGWVHAFVLAGLAGVLGYLLARLWIRFRPPSLEEAARRLERDSRLDHRPLAVLVDRLAGEADPLAEALWQVHRRRMSELAGRMRLGWPAPGMAARDPWGLRAAVLLLLVIAVTVGGRDAPRRIDRAVSPPVHAPGFTPDDLEVWITPPAYTGAPPIRLMPDRAQKDPVGVPAGSTVLAVLAGGWGTARLVIDGDDAPFEREPGTKTQRIERRLEAGRRLAVRQAGRTLAAWPIAVTPDALPSVAFTRPPEAGERGRLRLDLAASDDWGLAGVSVAIRRFDQPGEEPLVVELPLPGSKPRTADLSSWQDLTAHPWAGLPVTMTPVATDGLGQSASGEPVTVTLPERGFNHPVARALVEQRRRLTEDPAAAPDAIEVLDRILDQPQSFGGDLKAFLAISATRSALFAERFDLAEVQDLLWNAALRIEDGDLADSERTLEEARRELEKALAEGATPERLQELVDRFQAALERMLDALAQHMAETGQAPAEMQAGDRMLTQDELRQMLDSMRDMAATGARDALHQMLKDMSQMMAGLQAATPQKPNGPAVQALRALNDLAKRQQQLLEQSFQQSQQGGQGSSSSGEAGSSPSGEGGAAGGSAAAQEGLRRALGDVARRLGQALGDVPDGLGQADKAMTDAAGALRKGQWDDAADAQGEALKHLQDSAQEAMDRMGTAGAGPFGLVPHDPLGRPTKDGFGTGDDGTTRIPDRAEVKRVQEILQELRRRAGDPMRPEPEHDYLRRLLKQW
ncbi:MAG: TIGR02302 family protein [Solirubrobacterales bacterium]